MPEPLPPDPYKALGIPKDATTDAVKKAFRKLALTSHPDKIPKSLPEHERKVKEELFHNIRSAHDLLVDDDERKRYDLRVERDALMARRPTYGPSISASQAKQPPSRPQPQKSTTTPIFSSRPAPVYETREPKKSYEDDYTRPRYDTRRTTTSAKRYEEDHYDVSSSTNRRSSGRAEQDRRDRDTRADDERLRRKQEEARLKAEEKRLWDERERQRDRDRRRATTSKRQAMVESETDSDSDEEVNAFMRSDRHSPERKPRYEEDKKYDHRKHEKYDPYARYESNEDQPRRSRKYAESDDSEDGRHYTRSYGRQREEDPRLAAATKHIVSSGGKAAIVEKAPSHDKRPMAIRSHGTSSKKSSPPPLPAAPPAPPAEKKRTSSRRAESSKSKLPPKKTIDIVEPPPISPKYDSSRRDYDSYEDRRDTKKSTSSSSRMPHTSRAATFNDKTSDKAPIPGIRRTQTAPNSKNFASPGNTPLKPSRLQNQISEESDSSDSDSPPPRPRMPKTTSYRYDDRAAHVVHISPETLPTVREDSRSRPVLDRTSSSTVRSSSQQQRAPPQRSQTFNEPQRRAAHSASNSGDKHLFGEVRDVRDNISWSQRILPEDIRYSDYPGRRGSADDAQYSRKERDAESYMNSRKGGHPGMGNRQTSYATEVRA